MGLTIEEPLQGHEQWRGPFPTVIASAENRDQKPPKGNSAGRMFEGVPIVGPRQGSHLGFRTPGARFLDLTREIANPLFWHFSIDDSGMHVVSDSLEDDSKTGKRGITLLIGSLSRRENPLLRARYLLHTRSSGKGQPAHPHPFFSPDARMVFFNSDADGIPQIWMATGYQFPD